MSYVKTEGDTTNTTIDNKQDNPTEKDDDKTTNTNTNKDVVNDGKSTALGFGVVNLQSLNVRTGPSTDYEKVGTVTLGSRYAYYQKSGNWVRIEKGWISTSYFYIEGTTGEGAGNGTITGDGLNIRTGPGTGFGTNGSYKKDEAVKILTQINGWGYTGKGWISMKYVKMDGTVSTGSKGKGTITADALNIRKSGSNTAEIVGKYYKNDVVEILEVSNGWGRTDKGWISMAYVNMDETTITSSYKTGTGTITATELNIRESDSINAKSLGSYKNGEKVTILEVKGEWGKTDKGWINLKYVKMD
jgi:N-acetylmuramoyl-L-alanine amidase